MGVKDINELKVLMEKQISSQYSQALNSITKKEILDQIEKNPNLDLPENLVEQKVEMRQEILNLRKKKNIN